MRRLASVALAVLAITAQARAEGHPFGDAYHDSGDAPLVVEARIIGGDRVEVTRTIFAAKPLSEGTTELRVEGLSDLDRRLTRGDRPELLVADEVVLFLHASGDAWKPCELNHDRESVSACGAYFVRGDRVWCYERGFIPGPCSLVTWPPGEIVQGTLDDLRAVIASGLAARRAWEGDLATEDPEERAKRLVRWFDVRTSPDKDHCPYIRALLASEELADIGASAVPALLGVLASTDDADSGERALDVLTWMRAAAKDAVPRLIELTISPGKLHLGTIAHALAEVADARAVPALRGLLSATRREDGWLIDEIARALRACKDPDAEKLIAGKLSTK